MDKDPIVKIGGTVDDAVNGNYKIDAKAVLAEAWQLTKQSRQSILLGLLFAFTLGVIASYIVGEQFGGVENAIKDPNAAFMMNVIVTLITWPFLAGVEMMGVFHAVGIKTDAKVTFAFLRRGSWVALCALLTSMFVSIGFSLFIIPGIFLAVIFSLTIPLVVEKHYTPFKAMLVSFKALRFQWFQLFLCYLFLMLALVVILVPLAAFGESNIGLLGLVIFFFGLSFLAPMYFHVKGILYREIFGLEVRGKVNSPVNVNTFDA